jgi:CHAT domain-containing protein
MAKVGLGSEYLRTFEDILIKTTQNHLNELYRRLIAPLRQRLRTKHLVIIPHGVLHHLPFQALYDGQDYLIDNYTISYAPSVSVYSLCHNRVANTAGSSLVLAVPDAGVPLIEEEASAVAEILPDAHLAIGPDATTSALASRGSQSRFIHIATHGYFREDQPAFSGIRLTDSYLSLFDIYQLHLPVELVTLSGCSTGLNAVAAGDEILGLVRGLICAGAQSALLTLWDVQDRSTAEFMKGFYSFLAAGHNKVEALREAVLKLRKSYPHPYYWAPFVLNGKVFNE